MASSALPWRDLRSLATLPYLTGAYLASLGVLAVAAWRLVAVREASVESMTAFLGVTVAWVASSYLRRASPFLIAAAPLGVVPFLIASAQGLYLDIDVRRVGLAWNVALFAAAYFVAGLALDRVGGHYAKGLHATTFVLLGGAVLWALPDRAVTVRVLAVATAFSIASAALVHARWHASFQWLVDRLFHSPAGLAHRTCRSLFAYLAAAALPVLILLVQSFRFDDPGAFGLTISLLAPAYLAAAVVMRRWNRDYGVPSHLGALAMATAAPLIAIPHDVYRSVTLAISISTFAAHAPAYREPRYLYLAGGLAAVLLGLVYDARGWSFHAYGLGLIGLGYAAFALGEAAHRLRARRAAPIEGWRWAYAEPAIVIAMIAIAIGLAVTQREHELVLGAFALAALFFAIPAVVYREPLFFYATAALAPVAFVAALGLTGLDERFFGLAVIPGVALYVGVSYWWRVAPPPTRDLRSLAAWLAAREAPFLLVALTGTVALPLVSFEHRLVLGATLGAAAAAYGYMTWRLRAPGWLHGAVWAAMGALVAAIYGTQPDIGVERVALQLLPVTALLQLAATTVLRREERVDGHRHRVAGLPAGRWSLPVQTAALGVAALSLAVSAAAHLEGALIAFTLAAVAAAMAHWSRRRTLAWATLVLAAIGVAHTIAAGAGALAPAFAYVALAGLALAQLLAIERLALPLLTRRPWAGRLRMWELPLTAGALASGTIALVGSMALAVASGVDREAMQPYVATTAAVGLIGITLSWAYRRVEAAYVSIAVLLGAAMLELVFYEIDQAQLYTAPAAGFLIAIGLLERRRGERELGLPFEVTGIVLLLGTTLLQAAGWQSVGIGRFGYGSILLIEAAAVLLAGLYLRHRPPFFAGIAGTLAAMTLLLTDPVYSLWVTAWWVIVALVGALTVSGYAFVEWRRQQIVLTAGHWLELLDEWD